MKSCKRKSLLIYILAILLRITFWTEGLFGRFSCRIDWGFLPANVGVMGF